jgi:tetratricopeptide (TPR) repeat protein
MAIEKRRRENMGRKTRSTEKAGEHRPTLPAPPPVSVEEACQLHERAVALREHGQHAEAATCARHALASFERACGPNHPDVANILSNLADICADQGNYAEAVLLAQRAVAIMEQATGSPDLELLGVQSLRTLAGVYRTQGRYAEAESLYQRALARSEATLSSDHLETAACLNDLAVLYKYTAQFATAERLYRRALAITTQALGPEHPDVATLYHNLGGLEHGPWTVRSWGAMGTPCRGCP